MLDKMEYGVVQELKVCADTKTSLVAAITIALTYNSKIQYWAVENNTLCLRWSKLNEDDQEFLCVLTDPNVIAKMVDCWLKSNDPTEVEPITDGDVKKGFKIELGKSIDVLTITPTYIVYGK